jgi:isocitrate dehydrogenase
MSGFKSTTMKSELFAEKNIVMRSTDQLFRDIYEKIAQEDDKETVLCSGIMNI